jgi:hypothetical protein
MREETVASANEIELAQELARCIRALQEVQPQVHGALPAQSVRQAIDWGLETLERCATFCANCGNDAGVGNVYCQDCEAERISGDEE